MTPEHILETLKLTAETHRRSEKDFQRNQLTLKAMVSAAKAVELEEMARWLETELRKEAAA